MNVYQAVSAKLDIETANFRAGRTNDLLPRRHEDSVGGEVGKRFSGALAEQLASGRYTPSRAHFVAVPKPGNTTRPAALLALRDRVIFEALVAALRKRVGQKLVSDAHLFWPRGEDGERRWREFEHAPLGRDTELVVTADIAGFYESIDHGLLSEQLIQMTGRRELVAALADFLERVMGARRGIPQGLPASDQLATAHLAPVDEAMMRHDFDFYRNGDDIRVGTPTYSDARHAIAVLEEHVRARGLLLNSAKSKIVTRSTYESDLKIVDVARAESAEKVVEIRTELLMDDQDELRTALSEAGLEDLFIDAGPYGDVDVDAAIDELREHLEATDVEIIQALFDDTFERRHGEPDALAPGQFHARLVESLRVFEAANSDHALARCAELLRLYPDKTSLIARYLLALKKSNASEIVRVAEEVLNDDSYRTALELAWLFRVVGVGASSASDKTVKIAREWAEDEDADWLARTEAMKLLAARGELEHKLVLRVWERAPEPFKADAIAAASAAKKSGAPWAENFLDGAAKEPVLAVVLRHQS